MWGSLCETDDMPSLILVVGVSLMAASALGCGESEASNCVVDGDARICFEREDPGAAGVVVQGLKPGSTLTVSSEITGEETYPINSIGATDGHVGLLYPGDVTGEVTVSGETPTGGTLVGTFEL